MSEQLAELLALARLVAGGPEAAQCKMRQAGLAIDDLDDPYQKLAFTFYNMLVSRAVAAEVLLDQIEEPNEPPG